METGKFKPYKGFVGTIEITDGKHHGRLLDIDDFVNYTANSLEELETEYHKAVDDYLSFLNELRQEYGFIRETTNNRSSVINIKKCTG